jgi:hypothetical protein
MSDHNHHEKKLWFRRKTYGWGWTPCTWQGWLATAIYVFFLILFVGWLEPTATYKDVILQFGVPFTLVTLIFTEIAYKKGEKPRWQWGRKRG